MEVLGRVTESMNDNLIRVEILRASACGGKCGECSGSCGSKSYILAKNFDGAEKNDVVKIESDDKKVLFLSFAVFILPILVIVFLYNCSFFNSEITNACVSFLGGIVCFLLMIVFFRRLKTPVSRVYYSSQNNEYK